MSANQAMQERLRRQTGEASRAVEADTCRRAGRPPAAGDLFVLAETAEHSVEWVILDLDPADPRRLLAVPADCNSLAGSADVAVKAARGRLSLRCAYPAWIDAEACDPSLRTGCLEPETLERARRKQGRVERGTAAGSVLEREVDAEAEYLEWADVLEQARAAVAAEPEPGNQETGQVLSFDRRSRWGTTSSMLALAASILLLVTLGLGRKLMRSASEHQAVVAEQRAELARLEQERQRLADSHARDLARLDGERHTQELEHRQRIAELEASARPQPMVNLPLLILASSQLRGPADTLEVAPDAASLLLILQVEEPEAYDRYRLEVKEATTGRQVWGDSSLKPSRLSELTVLLPRSLVPDGRYELRLHGQRGDRPEQLMERILTIESTARQRPANGGD